MAVLGMRKKYPYSTALPGKKIINLDDNILLKVGEFLLLICCLLQKNKLKITKVV